MTDTYSVGGDTPGATRGPVYRGMRRQRRNPTTGQTEVEYWVQGRGYVPANDASRLSPQERVARQSAIDQANRFASMLPDLNRFEELNRSVPTGSVTQRFGQWAGNMPRVFGIDNPTTAQNEPQGYDEMRAITSRLTPSQRVEGSGSSSNLDVGMFREGLPNMGNTGPANSRIIQGYRRQAQDARDYADFMDWYWPRTGSLTNADAEFARYRQARQRTPGLSWRQFFNADGVNAQTRPGNAAPAARGPRAGEVQDGYRFRGGDPANPQNWERVR